MRAGVAVLAAAAMVAAVPAGSAVAHDRGDKLAKVDHIVVIYEENHSFDNLYGGWEGVDGVASADGAHTTQVNQAGVPYQCLKQTDVNLTSPPLPATCTDTTTAAVFTSAFTNRPFLIDAFIPPTATTCPKPGVFAANGVLNGTGQPGGCTRDLVHRYYQEQYQLDGGRQDRYVTGSDAAGLTMGVYDTTKLPLYQYLHSAGHPRYAIADRFFQAAFGGSFLNHQWLVAAATPVWPSTGSRPVVNDGSANDLHSVVDANLMPTNTPLYTSTLPSTALGDRALTASCTPPANRGETPKNATCGDYAVNTIQPEYQPYAPGTPVARRLPPQTAPTIGDRLNAAGVDWAWYSGGWSNADGRVGAVGWTNGSSAVLRTDASSVTFPGGNANGCADPNADPNATFPNCPDKLFQYHHQALNYFASFAPGTQNRAQHLRDEQELLKLTSSSGRRCRLKPVSFVKPIGEENEHPGYASVANGSAHLVQLLQAIESSACAKSTMVIVTYDEFGGQWDHVPPPGQGTTTSGPHDKFGPGTRIPALILSPRLPGRSVVDHTSHDTTSILATIEHRFGLTPLTSRDASVKDLSSVYCTCSGRHDGGRGDDRHDS